MRKAVWLSLGVSLMLVAAACGEAAPPETVIVEVTGPTQTVIEEVEVTVPVEGPGTIVAWAKWGASGGEGASFIEVIQPFIEETGIQVRYQGVGDQIPTLLRTQWEGGDPPDVAVLPQPGVLNDFATLGALIPIEDIVGETIDSDFHPAARALGTGPDGVLYGVYFKGAYKSPVWYSPAVFEANAVTPPTTFDEWITLSQTLVDAGVTPICVGGADGWTLTDWFENIYLRSAGGEAYDQLTNRQIPWTDQTVKDAFAVMGSLIGVDAFVAGGLDGALQQGFGDSVKCAFGDDPQGAMVFEADFVGGVILGETNTTADGYDAFTFPSIGGSPDSVLVGGDLAVMLKDSPEARAMIEYLASPTPGEIWAGIGGFVSPNTLVTPDNYPDPFFASFAASLFNADPAFTRYDMSDLVGAFGSTAGAGLWGGFQDWLGDPTDIDGITQQLEDEATVTQGELQG